MLEGELRVTKFYGDQEIFLERFREFFGEIEILLDVPNSCSFGWSPTAGFFVCHARILGPATHLAYGGEGNHANAGDAIAQL